MSKDKEHRTDIAPAKPAHVEAPKCAVCGQSTGEMTGVGVLRWHKFCEDARPDVIAKVKARA